MTNNIQYGATSHYPNMSGRATAKSLGDGNWDRSHHRRTQYFTMEGFDKEWIRNCVEGAEPWVWGTSVPQYGFGQSPGRRPGGPSPEKQKQNVKLEYNFLRFHVHRKRAWTVFLCKHTQLKKLVRLNADIRCEFLIAFEF